MSWGAEVTFLAFIMQQYIQYPIDKASSLAQSSNPHLIGCEENYMDGLDTINMTTESKHVCLLNHPSV